MADYTEDDDLDQEQLDLAQEGEEGEEEQRSALPVKGQRKRSTVPYQKSASGVGASDLADFDFDSLITKPEQAPAKPKEKGLVDSLVDTAKSAGKAVKNFVAPDKNYLPGSVMNDVPQQAPLENASAAPVRPGVRKALEGQYDAASPEVRTELATRPGAAGDVFRQREAEYARRTNPAKALDILDPSAESRAAVYVDKGMDRKIAEDQGRLDARNATVGKTIGETTPSDFDFELAEKYNKDEFFSNPIVRGAVKGFEGYKQGVYGINQFVAELAGANEIADQQASGAARSKKRTDAIGDPANYGQRMFEGAIASISQQIPALIGGAVTGSQALALGAMAVQAYGQSYSEGRAAGQDIDQASVRAAQMAAFEILGEKFGLGDQMGALRKMASSGSLDEAIKLMAKGSLKEIPGEQLTTFGQFMVDKEGAGYGIRKEAEVRDLLSQMTDTLVQTMMQGGIMTGTPAAAKLVVNGPLQAADRAVGAADIAREIEGAVNEVPASDEYTRQEAVRRMDPTGTLDGGTMQSGTEVPATTREPEGDIQAQIGAMLDPQNPKDAVFIAAGTPVPPGIPGNVRRVDRPEGTYLTTNPEKATSILEAPEVSDEMVAEFLGIPESKSEVIGSGNEQVVQARDPEGNVVNEAVTDGSGANEEAVAATVPPGGNVGVTTPEEAQAERAEKVQQETIVPGQEDSDISAELENVATVDEDGNPVTEQTVAPTPPVEPPAPPQEPPVQTPPPVEKTAPTPPPVPPVEPPVVKEKKPRKPKAPKQPEQAEPADTKQKFAERVGVEFKGDERRLEGVQSEKLAGILRRKDTQKTLESLSKSKNPIIRHIGEAGLRNSQRFGKALKVQTNDKSLAKNVNEGYNAPIIEARTTLGALNAMVESRAAVAKFKGTSIPPAIKSKVIFAERHPKTGNMLRTTMGAWLAKKGVKTKAEYLELVSRYQTTYADKARLDRLGATAKNPIFAPEQVGGLYDPQEHLVTMRKGKDSDEAIVAHEVTHALTTEALADPTPEQAPHVKAMKKLFEFVKTQDIGREYGLTNEYEFIAEGFSNPEFQFKLSKVKYENTTAWGKFTELVARILGLKNDNALTELLAIGEKLMGMESKQSSTSKPSMMPTAMPARLQPPKQGQRFNLRRVSVRDYLQAGLQDRFNRIKRVQEDVVAQGGAVTTDSNVYKADERYHGAAASKVGWFTKYKVKPLMRDMGRAGVDPDDVGLYLYAKHAKERNRQVASINPQMPDGGSGMTNAQADAILRTFAQDPQIAQIKRFADRLLDITRDTRKVMLEGHLVDQATLNQWDAAYKNYVPLKGFEKIDEFGNKQGGGGRGYDVRGTESRRALGRQSKAGNILENIIMDHERAINRAERNKVSRSLLRFVLQNRDPELWEVNKVVHKAEFRKSPSPGHVIYKLETVKDKDRTITVKENGQEYHIVIHDPKMLEQLLGEKGALTMEGLSADFFRYWSGFNRYLTKMWTALNPAFTLINAIRDTTTAFVHGATAVGPGFAAKVAIMAPTAIRAIYRQERQESGKLTIGPNGPQNWDEWYQQYQEDGGKAGFYMFSQLEDKERELRSIFERAANRARGTSKRKAWALTRDYLHELHDIIMDANGAIENMNRLAAYRVAIENYNMSREEAASLAKNLTVNFNRRGSLTPLIGSFYLFFNPAVQGTARMVQAWRDNPAMMSGFIASMVGVGYLGAMLSDDEDENGMPYWDKIADYERQKNFIITVGGNRITLPLAYGYGLFVHMGYLLRDLQKGRPMASVGLEFMNSALRHFSPIGLNTENPANVLVPTVAIPVQEAWTGIKGTGQPLMPAEKRPDGSVTPDYERYWSATRGTIAQKVTTALAEMTDFGEGPMIDVSPETITNYVKGYAGGGGTFLYDTINSIATVTAGDGLEAAWQKDMFPVAKAFYKHDNGKADQAYFMKQSEVALAALERFKKYQDSDDPEAVKRLEKNRDLAELGVSVQAVRKATAALRKRATAIHADKDASAQEKAEALKEVEKERTTLYSQWNAMFYKAERGIKEE